MALQREVGHPDLLAHLIRPQEPQPDLLGNLMHDSVLTQTKRMLLSLGTKTLMLACLFVCADYVPPNAYLFFLLLL